MTHTHTHNTHAVLDRLLLFSVVIHRSITYRRQSSSIAAAVLFFLFFIIAILDLLFFSYRIDCGSPSKSRPCVQLRTTGGSLSYRWGLDEIFAR